MARNETQLLPDFTAELEEIRNNGITTDLLYKIIRKHLPNSDYNRDLYKRYMGIESGVPIYSRKPRYEEENPINNKVSHDYFGKIVDFKTGYIAGKPFTYSYNNTEESEEETGGEAAVDEATKSLTDFTTRNNMYGVDMEVTKNASIYGYSGRLFFIDNELNERVKAIHGFETIILSDADISEPEYAIRYYKTLDINGTEIWTVEFYDNKYVTTYKGDLFSLEFVESKEHMFDYCPLQGVANNAEHMGDAEKVLSEIDAYDRIMSDNVNEIEAFANALMIVQGHVEDEVITKAQKTGVLVIPPTGSATTNSPVSWLTKNINDSFTEHNLQRLEESIFDISNTPNLKDETFGTASGESLKFKLHGLETKCATYQASIMNAAHHMWKVLCSSWAKKGITADPLQFTIEPSRNFPLAKLTEAQTAQAQIAAGLPKEWVFSQMSDVDDVDYLMELIKSEKEDSMELFEMAQKQAISSANNKSESDGSEKEGEENGLQKEEE